MSGTIRARFAAVRRALKGFASVTLWVLKVIALFCFILVTWVVGVNIIRQTDILTVPGADLASILFGASSLALFVFSIVLAILAIVGWQTIKDTMREQVDISVEALKNEMRGRVFTTMGYITGEMSLRFDDAMIEVADKERLSEAINVLQRGYEFLERIDDEKVKFMALNNFVFYSLIDDDRPPRAAFLLEKADELMRAGQAHGAANLMLTACGVIVRYEEDEKKRREALAILEGLKNHPRLSSKKRNEAKYYLHLASSKTTLVNSLAKGAEPGV